MPDTTSPRAAYQQYLMRIAEQVRQDAAAAGPAADDEKVAELVSAFRDAVLSLYNNTLRVCGVPVGDADSESHSVMIYERLGRELDSDIGDGLVKARRAEIAHLEAEVTALTTAIARLTEEAAAAAQAKNRIETTLVERQRQLEQATARIRALKELV